MMSARNVLFLVLSVLLTIPATAMGDPPATDAEAAVVDASSLANQPVKKRNMGSILGAWETERAAVELLSGEGMDEDADNPLLDLLDDLAHAIFVPSASFVAASGQPDAVTMEIELSYPVRPSANPLGNILKGLDFLKGKEAKVCIAADEGVLGRISASKWGLGVLLERFKVPAGTIEPVPYVTASVDGDRIVLTREFLGAEFFEALHTAAEKRKSIVVRAHPMPSLVPVKLTVETTAGERVSIPVELEGAKQHIQVAKGTAWKISGADGDVPLDTRWPGQKFLFSRILQRGAAEIEIKQVEKYYPSVSRALDGKKNFEVHVHGEKGGWFGYANVQIGGSYTVRRDLEGCDVHVRFEPSPRKTSVGALPAKTWKDVTGLRIVDPNEYEVDIGYLNPPACAAVAPPPAVK